MTRTVILFALVLTLAACTDAPGAARALEQAGYTNVSLDGYDWMACGKDDSFSTKFSATGPNGKPASGAVCSGFMKGSTIRLD